MAPKQLAAPFLTPQERPKEPFYVLPFSYFLDYLVRPCVFGLVHRKRTIWMWIVIFFGVLTVAVLIGAANSEEVGRDKGALKFLAQTPFTPLLLIGATIVIMAMYGEKQLSYFERNHPVPLPILYPFFIGKGFMVIRMFMAYDSGELGKSLDFFVYQEMLLMSFHVVCCAFILTFVPQNPAKLKDMIFVFRFIFIMDCFKTVFNYLLRYHLWKEGEVKDFVDKLPDVASQVCASLVIHGILDIMQSATTVFTMFISRAMRHSLHRASPGRFGDAAPPIKDQNCRELSAENKREYDRRKSIFFRLEADFVRFNLLKFDGWWCRHLFQPGYGWESKTRKAQLERLKSFEQNAKHEMEEIASCYASS